MSSEVDLADQEARARALDLRRSFIVQAPAGSGKTELLTQRYLALLAHVAWPEEVVAITFTRKAAGEMRSRVLRALARAGAGVEGESAVDRTTAELARAVLAADAAREWGLADNPARLRIQTIDALCVWLAGQMPLLSRLGGVPKLEEDARALYLEAARETLAQLETPRWSHPVAALLQHLDNDTARAEALLARLLGRRDQWLRHRHSLDREGLTKALVRLVGDRLQAARAAFPPEFVADLLFCLRYAAGNLSAAGSRSPILAAGQPTALPDADESQLAAWQGIAHLLLSKDRVRQRPDNRIGFPPASERGLVAAEKERRAGALQRIGALLQRVEAAPEFVAALAEVRRLAQPEYTEEQWRLIDALRALLPLAVAQLELVFRAHGTADFVQVLLAANQALGEPDEPTDLALALDHRVQHLLIDEFQDTSLTQYELLLRLTAGWQPDDGRTLFAVGDPMQSIYRFREAEVGLFLHASREGIGNVRLEPLALTRNFRSQSGLVEWVNRVFPQVLPAREDPVAGGAIPFSASIPGRSALAVEAVSLHGVTGGGNAEARRVLELVRAAMTEDPQQKIAVLVRSRSHLNSIVPALKSAGLRFRAVDIEPLSHRPAIQDLHALTRALLQLADRAAWLSLLRAPWCGLALRDLEALAGGQARDDVLWVRMTDAAACTRLGADGQARLARLVDALSPPLALRVRGSLRSRVESAWLRLGGPACVEERGDLDDVQAYLDLLERLEQGGELEDLAALEQELAKLYALPDTRAPQTLQVMTIHKAKGLEFDTVILPGLGGAARPDDPELLRWMERPRAHGDSDLLLAAIGARGDEGDPIYAGVTHLLQQCQEYEDGRLLYVAATRACRRLHLVAQLELEHRAGGTVVRRPSSAALLGKLWPALQADFEQAARRSIDSAVRSDAIATPDPAHYPLRRLALHWAPPPPPSSVQWRAAPREEQMRELEVEFSWASEVARHVGSVVHLFLHRMAEDGPDAWDRSKLDAMDSVLQVALKQQGVPAAELGAALGRVRQALRGVLGDARGRWLLSREHGDARSEYRLSGELEGAFVNVALDRTFIDAHGVRWIVDYKTGTHEGTDIDAFLDRERERYRAQLERYAALLARMESRPTRLALYFPLLQAWREWPAPAATS
jgi:ATP-dependent exoDNAse (exonuclease V) beta subunit